MTDYRIEALSEANWPAFQTLVSKHNGIFGGCWCLNFHDQPGTGSHEGNSAAKKRLVETGVAHHCLVMDGEAAIGWCEYGTPRQLPNIYHRKQYDASGIEPTNYRLPCFFVDRNHRREGVATMALHGAIDLIAGAGGGSVEGYPRVDVGVKKMSASFLFSGSIAMFEGAGFTRVADLGKFRCIMRREVAAAV